MNPNDFKEITGYNDTKFIVPNDYPEDDNTKNIFGIIEILFDRNYNHTTTSDDTSSASNKTDSSPRSVSSASTIFDSKLGTNGGSKAAKKAVKAAKGAAKAAAKTEANAETRRSLGYLTSPTLSPAETFANEIFNKVYNIITDTQRMGTLTQCLESNFHDDVTITPRWNDNGLYFNFSLPSSTSNPPTTAYPERNDINKFTKPMRTPSYRPFHLSLHHNDTEKKPSVTEPGVGKGNLGAIHFRRNEEEPVGREQYPTNTTYRYQQRLDLGDDGRICGFTNRVIFENYKHVDSVTSNLSDDTMRGVIDCLNGHIFDYTPPSSGTMRGPRSGPFTFASMGVAPPSMGVDPPLSMNKSDEFKYTETDDYPTSGGFKTTKPKKNKTRKNKTTKTRKIKRRKKTRKRSKDISKTKTRKHR